MSRAWWSMIALQLAYAASCLACAAALGSSNGRVFEQVSPVYKGGAGATEVEGVSQDGESVAYFAPDAFEGAPTGLTQNIDSVDYLARRGPLGWRTMPVAPPASLTPVALGENRDVSADGRTTIALAAVGRNNESAEQEGREEAFLVHSTDSPDTSSNWRIVGSPLALLGGGPLQLRYMGASQDFCHLLVDEFAEGSQESLTGPEVMLEAAENAAPQLYEVDGGCAGAPPALRLVTVDNEGKPISPGCRPNLGIELLSEISSARQSYNAISADGKTIFFTACIGNNLAEHQLFARLGASRTLEVSKPLAESCGEQLPCPEAPKRPSAEFVGASENGSTVYFMTKAPLAPSDTDTGNDLYMAKIGCPVEGCSVAERRVTELVQVSHDPSGGEARVQGVVRTAPDGSRAYFVAEGNLLSTAQQEHLEQEGRPTPQTRADNLYAYDSTTGAIEFVSDLCSGASTSGAIGDRHCPNKEADNELWSLVNGRSEAQTAGSDGRYLVFSSFGQLTSDDTDAARDVYRYDAATDALERVSSGENGYHANGNNDGEDASVRVNWFGGAVRYQLETSTRAISEDGSRIVFETAEPLSPRAINHLTNVYEWHKNVTGPGGTVSLVSGGSGTTPVENAVISPSGRDIFFSTTEGLVPQDVDGAPDIYDARVGGGFPAVPTAPEPCSGDTCQGSLTNPAPLLVPSSVSQLAGENLSPSSEPSKRAVSTCRRGYHRRHGRCVKATRRTRRGVAARRRRVAAAKRGGRS